MWKVEPTRILPVLPIDTGNRYVKTGAKRNVFMFPSISSNLGTSKPTGYAAIGQSDTGDSLDNMVLYEGHVYLGIGNIAAKRGRDITELSGAYRFSSKFYRMLVQAAMSQMPELKGDIRIVTGMPGLWHDDSTQEQALIENLLGEYNIEQPEGRGRKINVIEVVVFREPRAAFYLDAIAPNGSPKLANVEGKKAAYVDIGGLSWDLSVFDGVDFVPELSKSAQIGFNDILSFLGDHIRDNFNMNLDRQRLQNIVDTGKYRIDQKNHSFNGLISDQIERTASRGVEFMKTTWGQLAREFDEIKILGGSETDFWKYIQQAFPNAQRFGETPTAARMTYAQAQKVGQFVNVLGYKRYADFCDWRVKNGK